MTGDLSDQQLLERFHRQIRLAGREDEPSRGIVQDTDGLVVRRYPVRPGTSYCMVECPRGLGVDPDLAISRQVDFFTGRKERVEWKTYSYDEPADLTERLRSPGFVAEEPETLLLGEVGALVNDVDLPRGVRVRAVSSDADLARIDELMRVEIRASISQGSRVQSAVMASSLDTGRSTGGCLRRLLRGDRTVTPDLLTPPQTRASIHHSGG